MHNEDNTENRKSLPIDKLFRAFVDLRASEMHLQVGKPVIYRVNGELLPIEMPVIDEDRMRELCWPLMDNRNREIFESVQLAEFDHLVEYNGELRRFRVKLFHHMGAIGMLSRMDHPHTGPSSFR